MEPENPSGQGPSKPDGEAVPLVPDQEHKDSAQRSAGSNGAELRNGHVHAAAEEDEADQEGSDDGDETSEDEAGSDDAGSDDELDDDAGSDDGSESDSEEASEDASEEGGDEAREASADESEEESDDESDDESDEDSDDESDDDTDEDSDAESDAESDDASDEDSEVEVTDPRARSGFPSFPASPGPIGRIDGTETVHSPPKLNHGPPELLYLDALEDDVTFQVRPEGEVALLATDLARLGQLFPIDVRPLAGRSGQYQVVCGFRRVAALKFLHREKVLARVHPELSDEDALVMALASAIHASPVTPEELEQLRDRLEQEGRLSAATRDMLEKALAPDDNLAPEGVESDEEEVDADELAADVTLRQADINQDLALLADIFDSLDDARKAELLQQLRYAETLVEYLEDK